MLVETLGGIPEILFASLFKYRHEANEVWRNTCLVNLSSKTRMNGKRSSLEGQLTPGGFRLESKSAEGKETSDAPEPCLASYAYWDKERLDQSQLVNPQTGQISASRLTFVGTTALPKANLLMQPISANQYMLKNELATIMVWYDQEGRWLALETDQDGRTLTYINTALLKD